MSCKWYGNKIRKLEKSISILEEIEFLSTHSDMPNHSKEFLESLASCYKSHGGLTIKQYKALQKVATLIQPEQIANRKKWADSYGEKQREIVNICAMYYIPVSYTHLTLPTIYSV